jgi:hypothetical protein
VFEDEAMAVQILFSLADGVSAALPLSKALRGREIVLSAPTPEAALFHDSGPHSGLNSA